MLLWVELINTVDEFATDDDITDSPRWRLAPLSVGRLPTLFSILPCPRAAWRWEILRGRVR